MFSCFQIEWSEWLESRGWCPRNSIKILDVIRLYRDRVVGLRLNDDWRLPDWFYQSQELINKEMYQLSWFALRSLEIIRWESLIAPNGDHLLRSIYWVLVDSLVDV